MARIAVLIPVYNAARFLPHTLECLRKQTFQDFSVTAADDGSDDGSLEILRSFPEVQVLALPHGGVAKARNALLAASSGEYVAFLDADDLWKSEKLEKQVKFMLENNYAFTCTDYEKIDETGKSFYHHSRTQRGK